GPHDPGRRVRHEDPAQLVGPLEVVLAAEADRLDGRAAAHRGQLVPCAGHLGAPSDASGAWWEPPWSVEPSALEPMPQRDGCHPPREGDPVEPMGIEPTTSSMPWK